MGHCTSATFQIAWPLTECCAERALKKAQQNPLTITRKPL
jgi:hypothetical protein